MFFILAQIGCGFFLILKQGFLPNHKSKLFDFGFIGFLVLSAFGYKIVKFHHHLPLQYDVWPSTVHFQFEIGCWLLGAITFKIKGKIWQFLSLWNPLVVRFLFICELQDLNIIWLVNLKIYTWVFISCFFFFDFQLFIINLILLEKSRIIYQKCLFSL